jgi:hypothetical protein
MENINEEVLLSNKYLEKASSFLAMGALTHLAQNGITKHMLSSRKYARSLAKSFSQGVHGVVNTSKREGVKNFVSGLTVPDMAIGRKEAHKLGSTLAPHLALMSKRQQVGMRMISEGRFHDVVKHRFHKDPALLFAARHAQHSSGIPVYDTLVNAEKHAGPMGKTFARKDLPLLSNISKNISRGGTSQGKNFKPGMPGSKGTILGSIAAGAIEPIAGAINSVKSIASSDRFKATKLGGRISQKVQEMLINKPAKRGMESGAINKFKNKVYELAVNPVSAHLERTTHALKNIGK